MMMSGAAETLKGYMDSDDNDLLPLMHGMTGLKGPYERLYVESKGDKFLCHKYSRDLCWCVAYTTSGGVSGFARTPPRWAATRLFQFLDSISKSV